jgi:xanthine dehydrogenase accessory protein XdhC
MTHSRESALLAAALAAALARSAPAVLVRVEAISGSAPRDAGAAMLVTADAIAGTIGGGALEWAAIERARSALIDAALPMRWEAPLGPALGQCCGGRMTLAFARADATTLQTLKQDDARARAAEPFVAIFGAGHVGCALAQALAPLPFSLAIFDDRDEERVRASAPGAPLGDPEAAVAALPPAAAIFILTHSHTLDFRVARAALERGDAAYVGMVGSATKRARFVSWLAASGADPALAKHLTLPIAGGRLRDKRPAVIAALAAAELLERLAPALRAVDSGAKIA